MTLLRKQSQILNVVHEVIAAPFPHIPRDFVLKIIRFKDENQYFCYFTSTPDSLKPIEVNKKGKFSYIRGELILGLQVLRKVGGDWRLFTATQRDMKVQQHFELQMAELDQKAYEKYLKRLMKLYHQELRSAIHQYQDFKVSKKQKMNN